MLVKFWGVRGSLGTPLSNAEYRHKVQAVLTAAVEKGLNNVHEVPDFLNSLPPDLQYTYGGDTTCVTVTGDDGSIYIIDCGSGIRRVGDSLIDSPAGRGEGNVRIFLTHTHWDHIQGLMFFKPIYIPGNVLTFYSPFLDLETRLVRQQIDHFFPVPFEALRATKKFVTLQEKEQVEFPGGMQIDFFALKHPGGSFAYRFRQNGHTFIFATDAEFTGEDLVRTGPQQEFFAGADLVALDAQYTLDESFTKLDWGHTSYTMAVNCGVQWKVKNLVLIHHEPGYSDARLFENHQLAVRHREEMRQDSPRIYMGREGMTFRLGSP